MNYLKENIKIIEADNKIKEVWSAESQWDKKIIESHMHLTNGISFVAKIENELIGMISLCWKKLININPKTIEGYIDIIEVKNKYRRKGIASLLIKKAEKICKKEKAYQIRAWSSEDKIEAIQMWRSLKFGICPAKTYPNDKEVKGVYVIKII